MSFSNLRIGVKLIGAFLVIASFSLVVGLVGMSNAEKINDAAGRIYAEDLLGVSYIKEANIDLVYIGRARANYMLASTPEERQKAVAEIQQSAAKLKENMDKARPLIINPETKAMVTRFDQSYEAYYTQLQTLLASSGAQKYQERDETLSAALVNLRKRSNEADDLLSELTRLKEARAEKAYEEAGNLYASSRQMIIFAIVAALALGVLLGYMISRSVTKPLNSAMEAARRLAEGDLTVEVEARGNDETGQLLRSIKAMIEKLRVVVSEVSAGAEALSSASEQVSATAQSLAQAASEQAAGVEQTSASVEEMTASIAQNSENAKVTDGMATKAAQEASEGGEAVKATVTAMNQIAKKIVIIDDIAYQTNLLALNAAIEAARAGEHGKGFAVVAAEVRKLAERSQVAAQEIGEVATNSVELAARAGHLLDEMVPNIRRTSDLVQEIAAASEEQTSGVSQINAAVTQLSQTTQTNAASSEELAATAEEMSSQAEQLQSNMAFFRLQGGSRPQAAQPVKRGAAPRRALPTAAPAMASAGAEPNFVSF
jgi:methyl-accepting chemotaxis protein